MVSEKELHEIIEIALDNTTTNSCDNVEGTTKSIMLLDYSEEQLDYIFNQLLQTKLFQKVGQNRFALSSFGNSIKTKFGSYEYYMDSLKNAKTTTHNNISGNIINAPIIQGSDFRDFVNNDTVDATTATDKQKSIKKSKIDIKVIWQYLAWIATISAAILAYYRFFNGK